MKEKRNLWPFGIILAFALFVPATAGLVVVACLHSNELVSPDYYEQEIRYQRHIEQVSRTRPLPASVAFDATRQSIQIVLPSEHARQALKGNILLYRPSDARLDRQWLLTPDAQGLQTIDVHNLPPGLWKVRVNWTVQGQDYVIEQKMILNRNNQPWDTGAHCVFPCPFEGRGVRCSDLGSTKSPHTRLGQWLLAFRECMPADAFLRRQAGSLRNSRLGNLRYEARHCASVSIWVVAI